MQSLPIPSPAPFEKLSASKAKSSVGNPHRKFRGRIREYTVPARASMQALVVDDCGSNRLLYCHFLRMLGFSVRSSRTAEEAIEICKNKSFQLILMDISLPGMNGIEASKIICNDKDTENVAQVVFCTGYLKVEPKIPEGRKSLLLKPFTKQKLLEHLSGLNLRAVL